MTIAANVAVRACVAQKKKLDTRNLDPVLILQTPYILGASEINVEKSDTENYNVELHCDQPCTSLGVHGLWRSLSLNYQ